MKNDIGTLIAALQRKLIAALKIDIEPSAIDPDSALASLQAVGSAEAYQLDSVDLVEFIVALENELGVQLIEDDEVMSMQTLRSFADFLQTKVSPERLEALCAQ